MFKAKSAGNLGSYEYKAGYPVLYIDSAKTSTIEGAATTVYATGGRGNTNLIAWEGEKTLTFTVEDALLSPEGFAILSGAGLIKPTDADSKINVHITGKVDAPSTNATDKKTINITKLVGNDTLSENAPAFVIEVDQYDSFIAIHEVTSMTKSDTIATLTIDKDISANAKKLFVDFYIQKKEANVSELQIDAGNFAGYYYVEADTLFRRKADGVDLPANITFPNVKIQSNFTFSMASSGDPSTFTFTMDALPGYTVFDDTKEVLCVIQIIDDTEASSVNRDTVMEVTSKTTSPESPTGGAEVQNLYE